MIDKPKLMANQARQLVQRGFHFLKVKAGLDPDSDIAAIREIRQAVGPSIRVKMDANQGGLATAYV
jgi:L-alanine-DL-glutamate epimerase-like enolase superfamily enzyme